MGQSHLLAVGLELGTQSEDKSQVTPRGRPIAIGKLWLHPADSLLVSAVLD